MTVNTLVPGEFSGPWTIEDLQELPDQGYRYEIIDGSLLVTPPPAVPHIRVTTRLRNLLHAQTSPGFVVVENGGITLWRDDTTYRIPDLTVLRSDALLRDALTFEPADAPLVIEVLSPRTAGDDLVMKRYGYGRAGIPQYWIVDSRHRGLTVLRHDGAEGYLEETVVRPGTEWHTEMPFPIALDPANFV